MGLDHVAAFMVFLAGWAQASGITTPVIDSFEELGKGAELHLQELLNVYTGLESPLDVVDSANLDPKEIELLMDKTWQVTDPVTCHFWAGDYKITKVYIKYVGSGNHKDVIVHRLYGEMFSWTMSGLEGPAEYEVKISSPHRTMSLFSGSQMPQGYCEPGNLRD